MATGPMSAREAYPWLYSSPSSSYSAPAAVSATTGVVASNPYATTDLGALQQQIMGMMNVPQVSYNMPSRGEIQSTIEASLRPRVDQYVTGRQKQTLTNRAELDVDAASRGMGRSTWVTDMKDRAMDAEASDIANAENQYWADVMAQVEGLMMQHSNNAFAAQQLNAQNAMTAQGAALQAALGLYSSNLDWERQQELLNKKSSGRSSSSSRGTFGSALSAIPQSDMALVGVGNLPTLYNPTYMAYGTNSLTPVKRDQYDALDAARTANIASQQKNAGKKK